MNDWQPYVVEWLRRAAGDDLGAVYILGSDEVPPCDWADLRRDFSGYHHPFLDVRHRALLERRGQWQGRGFTCVLDSELPVNALVAIGAHELAHYLDDKADQHLEAIQLAPAEFIAERVNVQVRVTAPPRVEQRDFHGLRFNRAASHLVHRLRESGFGVHPDGLGVCGRVLTEYEYHGNRLYRAFEPEYRASGSIVEILRTEPPPEAVAVWGAYVSQRDDPKAAAWSAKDGK